MKQFQRGNVATGVIIIMIALIGFGGWVANIVKLIGSDFDPLTGVLVGRIIGVFLAPLGAILGFV